MKKTFLTLAVVATIGLAGFHVAEAHPWGAGHHYGMGGNMMGQGYGYQLDEETAQARDKFLSETTELRKKMHAKRTELNAVLSSETPDEKKAARLSEELFDLREQMRKRADEAGLSKKGFGPGYCGGPGSGQGMGYGPHHRRW